MDIRRVAAFDFDGTLSRKDCLLPFLIHLNGWGRTAWHLFLWIPYGLAFLFSIKSRQRVKEALLRKALVSHPLSHLKKMADLFAEKKITFLIKKEGISRLLWHKKQGDHCILISANLSLFLEPWAKKAGFDRIIASNLELDGKGRVSGRLKGKNCFGEEKVRRLKEVLGEIKTYTLFAYGDSHGDLPLLAYADFAYYKSFEREYVKR
jgi:phosphatidylglycerophosphatase C